MFYAFIRIWTVEKDCLKLVNVFTSSIFFKRKFIYRKRTPHKCVYLLTAYLLFRISAGAERHFSYQSSNFSCQQSVTLHLSLYIFVTVKLTYGNSKSNCSCQLQLLWQCCQMSITKRIILCLMIYFVTIQKRIQLKFSVYKLGSLSVKSKLTKYNHYPKVF